MDERALLDGLPNGTEVGEYVIEAAIGYYRVRIPLESYGSGRIGTCCGRDRVQSLIGMVGPSPVASPQGRIAIVAF